MVSDRENYSSQVEKMHKDLFGRTLKKKIPPWVFTYNIKPVIVRAFRELHVFCEKVLQIYFTYFLLL